MFSFWTSLSIGILHSFLRVHLYPFKTDSSIIIIFYFPPSYIFTSFLSYTSKYPPYTSLPVLSSVFLSPGTISTSVSGSLNSCINLAFTLALAVPPVGIWKTLSEGWFDNLNGCPPLTTVEVAPVSLIADGIVPFRIMVLMSSCINGFSVVFCVVLHFPLSGAFLHLYVARCSSPLCAVAVDMVWR